ncbi:hypothetical protein [Nocardioides pyridinolyticus]
MIAADTRILELTGRTFHRARVRTLGFEAELLLSAAEHEAAPPIGGVVTGLVYLIADMDHLVAPPRRSWLRRRR